MTTTISLLGYLDAVASAAPAPGGGSVSAVVGGLGCSLGEMVATISLQHANPPQASQLKTSLDTFVSLRQQFVHLAAADESAYMAYREAKKLPKADKAEASERNQALEAALETAANVPLQIAEAAGTALQSLSLVAESGSKYLLADVSTASYLLDAAGRGALENVSVNIKSIKSQSLAASLGSQHQSLEKHIPLRLEAVMQTISARKSTT